MAYQTQLLHVGCIPNLLAAITAVQEYFVLAWRVVPSTQETPNHGVEEWAREGEGVRDVVVQAHHAGLGSRPGFDERDEVLGREAGQVEAGVARADAACFKNCCRLHLVPGNIMSKPLVNSERFGVAGCDP